MSEIRCSSCGQKNRVGKLKEGQKAVCGKCKTPLPVPTEQAAGGEPIVITDTNFDSVVRDGTPIVVDFWAPWCGPCRTIAPTIEAMARERGDVRFGKLNVDENPRTAGRFMVSGIPTLILFNDGAEQDRLQGAAGRPHIERWIDQQLR